MKLSFLEGTPKEVLKKIEEVLSGRKLKDLVSFEFKGNDLIMTISKLGTSTIEFKYEPKEKGFDWVVSKEKIALSHRVFKAEVMEKLIKIVETVGGKSV